MVVDCVWNVVAHAQKPDFVLRRNGRVHLNRGGASVQSTAGSWGVRISGSNARYTMFRGSVKGTGYPLHSAVSTSLPLSCVTVCHHILTERYPLHRRLSGSRGGLDGSRKPHPYRVSSPGSSRPRLAKADTRDKRQVLRQTHKLSHPRQSSETKRGWWNHPYVLQPLGVPIFSLLAIPVTKQRTTRSRDVVGRNVVYIMHCDHSDQPAVTVLELLRIITITYVMAACSLLRHYTCGRAAFTVCHWNPPLPLFVKRYFNFASTQTCDRTVGGNCLKYGRCQRYIHSIRSSTMQCGNTFFRQKMSVQWYLG